jgi:sigma-B regulation protein RsbU (phosphoserine phosphatase)
LDGSKVSLSPLVSASGSAVSGSEPVRTVLVVDDSPAQRMLLCAGLKRWGFTVLQAGSAEEALATISRCDVDLVLSDWMMPGMTGIDFCRLLRRSNPQRYIYFILLTSKSDKAAVAEGLDVGADDFLSKPVDSGELRARIRAGERLLSLERELRARNQQITSALDQLRDLYDSLDRDLLEARNLQLSILRHRHLRFEAGQASLLLRPSGHVGGDMVGCFQINENTLGLYSLDVSGHGVASALLTARLAGLLSGASADQNIAICRADSGFIGQDPALVAQAMNDLLLSEIETDRYATLAYAEIGLDSGRVRLVQAGHPHPIVQHADGSATMLGEGGLPVGLFRGAEFTSYEAVLKPGERLLLVSDGIVECPAPGGGDLGEEGLFALLERLAPLRGEEFIAALQWELGRFAGSDDFPDDVSCAMFEFGALPG